MLCAFPGWMETEKATVRIDSAFDNGSVSVRKSKDQSRAMLFVSGMLGDSVTIHNKDDAKQWLIGYPPGPLTNLNNER